MGWAIRAHAPVFASAVVLLAPRVDSPYLPERSKAEEAVSVESSIGNITIVLLRLRTVIERSWKRCCSAPSISLASRPVARRGIVHCLGRFHRSLSVLPVRVARDSQAARAFVDLGPECASRKEYLPLNLTKLLYGSMRFSHWATAESRCGRLACNGNGDDGGAVFLNICFSHCRHDCMACYRRCICLIITVGDCGHATHSDGLQCRS